MVNPDLFNEVPIFQLLDHEERKVLADQVSVKNFKKGQVVFKAGDPGGRCQGEKNFKTLRSSRASR